MAHSFYRIHRDLVFEISFIYQGEYYFFSDVKDYSISSSDRSFCLISYSGDVYTFQYSSDFSFHVTPFFDYIQIYDASDPKYDYVSFQGEYIGDSLADLEHALDLEW